MNFEYLLKNRNMTVYECSKLSNIPYSTLSDIIKGRTEIGKCSFATAYALAETLGITMEELYRTMNVPRRIPFELFKSSVQHDLKREGDLGFIKMVIINKYIDKYWHWEWYMEALYMLAMLDYLCRVNSLPVSNEYDELRHHRISETIYPSDILLIDKLKPELKIKERSIAESIPEFIRFNIVEKEIRDAV